MDEKKDYIFIFWSESHKSSEKLKSFISIEGEKMEIDPIYNSDVCSSDLYINQKK